MQKSLLLTLSATLLLDLIFSYNKADDGGGIAAFVTGSGNWHLMCNSLL